MALTTSGMKICAGGATMFIAIVIKAVQSGIDA